MHCIFFWSILSCSGEWKQRAELKHDQCMFNYGGKGAGTLRTNMKG